jgi:hypothetical protein
MSWNTVGFLAAVGLPLVVFVWALCWPSRIPKDKTVRAIRQRIEDEAGPNDSTRT